MPATITIARAEAHEALYLRLEALVRLAGGVGARRPGEPVPDEVRARAEDLLYESRRFAAAGIRSRSGRRGGVEPAAPTYGGLAAQLSEALAALETYEHRHTRWDGGLKCVVWQVEGAPLPVRRLNPRPVLPPQERKPSPALEQLRRQIADRIEQLNQG